MIRVSSVNGSYGWSIKDFLGVLENFAGLIKKDEGPQQPVQNQYNPQYQQQQPYQQPAPAQPEYYQSQEQENQGPPRF